MNAQMHAHNAYSRVNRVTRSDRSIEYELFAKITKGLAQNGSQNGRCSPQLAQSLHENRKLWITLAGAVAESENMLPDTLRAQIYYLAEFTALHTRKVLNGTADSDVLRDINLSIMQGLQSNVGEA